MEQIKVFLFFLAWFCLLHQMPAMDMECIERAPCDTDVNCAAGFGCFTDRCYELDGIWTDWTNWSTCSVTCGNGTKSRSRSCDGTRCAGDSSQTQNCTNEPDEECFSKSDYYIGSNLTTWPKAKEECEEMSARLVIINNEEEYKFLDTWIRGIRGWYHWIGLNCRGVTNCTWIDGTPLGDGFAAWAPNEPRNHFCIWIGYYRNKWDDWYCSQLRRYVCEYL